MWKLEQNNLRKGVVNESCFVAADRRSIIKKEMNESTLFCYSRQLFQTILLSKTTTNKECRNDDEALA